MAHLSLASTHYPRLPNLQSIGRSPGIDLEEPPYDPEAQQNEVELLKASKTCSMHNIDIVFLKLSDIFKPSHPGHRYCNKFDALKWSNYKGILHCWKGAEMAKKLKRLDELLVKRTLLQLQQMTIESLNAAEAFREVLVDLVNNEHNMWSSISCNHISKAISTNLTSLMDVCEDMRIQLNQSDSIWNFLYSNCRFKLLSRNAYIIMKKFDDQFKILNRICLGLIVKFIHLGFSVLGHCDLDKFEYEQLCHISKGIELFNNLITKFNQSYPTSHIAPLSLSFLLSIYARERAKYAAMGCKGFLFGSDEVLELFKKDTSVDWSVVLVHEQTLQKHLDDTENWLEFNFCNVQKNTSDKIQNDIFETIEKAFNIISSSYHPMTEFVRRERSFIENFFHSICHVTIILHSDPPTFEQIDEDLVSKRFKSKNNITINNKKSIPAIKKSILKCKPPNNPMTTAQNPTNDDDDRLLHKNCNIHWNDYDMSQRVNSLSNNYFNNIWDQLQQQLLLFLHTPSFTSQLSPHILMPDFPSIEPVQVCNPASHFFIAKVLQASIIKGLFPAFLHHHLLITSTHFYAIASSNIQHTDKLCTESESSKSVSDVNDLSQFNSLSALLNHILFYFLFPTKTRLLIHNQRRPKNLGNINNNQHVEVSNHNNYINTTNLEVPSFFKFLPTHYITHILQNHHITSNLLIYCYNQNTRKIQEMMKSSCNPPSSIAPFITPLFPTLASLCEDFHHVQVLMIDFLRQNSAAHNKNESKTAADDDDLLRLTDLYGEVLEDSLMLTEQLKIQLVELSSETSLSFRTCVRRQCFVFMRSELPVGKIWKVKELKETEGANDYVVKGAEGILLPVIDSVCGAHVSTVVGCAVEEFCMAWLQVILEKAIKFSHRGACLLEKDLESLKHWIPQQMDKSSLPLSQEAPSKVVLRHKVFHQFHNVIHLLKQQPHKKDGVTAHKKDGGAAHKKEGPTNITSSASLPVTSKENKTSASESTESDTTSSSSPSKSRPPLLSVTAANATFSSSGSSGSNPCSNASNSVLSSTATRFKNTFRGKSSNSLFDKASEDNDADKNEGACKYNAKNTKSNQDASLFKLFKSAKVASINTENNQNITNDLAHNFSDNKSNNKNNTDVNNGKSDDVFFVGKVRRISKASLMNNKNNKTTQQTSCNEPHPLDDNHNNNNNQNKNNNNQNNNTTKNHNNNINTKHDDLKDISIERRSEWLALRVRRNSRSWPKLSLCFSGSLEL